MNSVNCFQRTNDTTAKRAIPSKVAQSSFGPAFCKQLAKSSIMMFSHWQTLPLHAFVAFGHSCNIDYLLLYTAIGEVKDVTGSPVMPVAEV